MAAPLARPSAYYAAPVGTFLATSADEVLGALAAAHTFDLEAGQRLAWQEEIEILKASLAGLPGWLYIISRSRADSSQFSSMRTGHPFQVEASAAFGAVGVAAALSQTLSELVGHDTPAAADPGGTHFTFERGAELLGGEDG